MGGNRVWAGRDRGWREKAKKIGFFAASSDKAAGRYEFPIPVGFLAKTGQVDIESHSEARSCSSSLARLHPGSQTSPPAASTE